MDNYFLLPYLCIVEISSANIHLLFENFTLSDSQKCALLDNSPETRQIVLDIYKRYNLFLSSSYDGLCRAFDEAPSSHIFDKEFAVNISVSERDCLNLLTWCLLHKMAVDRDNASFGKDVLHIFGRFTLLYIGNDILRTSSSFRTAVLELLDILLSCKWSYDESIYLRITILNILLLLGINTKQSVNDLLHDSLQHLKEAKDLASIDLIQDSISWYITFMSQKPAAEEIKLDWLHAYIYKVRFVFLYCKKFSRSSDKRYPILMSAYSPIFRMSKKDNLGTGAKGLFLKKGERKRNNEYKPLESNVFYNATLGLFE